MFKLDKGANGKAADALHDCFFQQIVGGPNPLNPREMVIQVIPGTGIPIRDFFAAQALAGIAAALDSSRDTAEYAYRIADAMIEARKAEKPFNNSQFHEDHMSGGK